MGPRKRLSVLAAGLIVGLVAGITTADPAGASTTTTGSTTTTAPIQLTLPAPTGPDRIGTVSLHLIDPHRQDPWVPGRPRELMIQLWYPATDTARYPDAPYMTPGAATHFLGTLGVQADLVTMPDTVGHLDAPADRRGGPRPVLLYSPGFGTDRTIDTALVEELASRGYVVVTIDHPYDSSEVEFPGGRLVVAGLPPGTTPAQAMTVREADTRFVLDELTALDFGANPSVEHTPLPRNIAGDLDLSRIGMFGWSLGGATAASTMLDDPRVRAGVDMDGTIFGPVATAGLSRPFLLMSSQNHNRDNDPSWASFWANLRGWRLDLRLVGSAHRTYSDAESLLPPLAGLMGLTPEQLAEFVGTIDPQRATLIERVYLLAFFDQQLRHRHSRLLDGPSPRFPEMQFVP